MKKVLHKQIWRTGSVQIYVKPPLIPLIKSKNDAKLDKNCVRIKLNRDPRSEKPDIYKFKTALFDNKKLEEFLLFIRNFQNTLKASGTLADITQICYLRALWRGEVLRQLEMLYFKVGSTTTADLKHTILCLGMYISPINVVSKKKRVMRRGMRTPHGLKVRRYAAHMIELIVYLDAFPGAKESDKVGKTELNEIILNGMPNGLRSKSFIQGFLILNLLQKNL